MNRRGLFTLAGAALAAPRIGMAQSGQVVVGTWGGDYAALLTRHIETPLLRPRGIEAVQDVGPQTARMTKLIAERTSRRGSMDVVCLSDSDTHAMAAQGLLEELTPANVPNLAHVLPALRHPFGLPHIYSVRTVLYLPGRVDPPPRSYADLFDPRFRNRIGFSDLLYTVISESAAIVAGGNESNYAPGRPKLLEWRAMGARVFPSNETLAASLRSEESWATIMWLARGYMWRKAGIPLRHVVPAEGCSPYVSSACVPKNARNKDAAYAYLNAMLDPSAALGFAESMGFLPTTTNATLPAELTAEIGITAAEQAAMRRPDFDYIARMNNEVLNFWNREFKG